jgi:type IV secretory pathway VirB2 component (pilin)
MKKAIFNFLVVVSAYVAGSLESLAFGGGQEIGDALCEVVSWLSGPIGAAIASFAVIFLGIGAFFGKVTWGTALLTGVAIFTIFGAGPIVETVGGINAYGCPSTY